MTAEQCSPRKTATPGAASTNISRHQARVSHAPESLTAHEFVMLAALKQAAAALRQCGHIPVGRQVWASPEGPRDSRQKCSNRTSN